jgi:GNAT superfamily N-acetyltransferase
VNLNYYYCQMRIIKAGPEHAEDLAEIGKNSFWESHGHSASEEDITAYIVRHFNAEAFRKDLTEAANLYHIIYHENQMAGYSKMILNQSNENIVMQPLAKLERLYLTKSFYGLCIGALLFDYNLELAKKMGQKGMCLAVWKDNHRAIKFYVKQGFKTVGTYDFKISETHANPNHIMYLGFQD